MVTKRNLLAFSAAGLILCAAPAIHAHPAQAPQAMPVQVTMVKTEATQIWKKFSGRLLAVDQADIRPQVSGRITEIRFEDGQRVEKGDILLVIDPRPYEAALNQAKAAVAAAKTQSALAEKEYKRGVELVKTEAIPQRILDERANTRQVSQAAVQGAQAMLERAQLDLDYAYVKAPISGKVSRAEITVGNLVQSGPNAPLLTSIVSDSEIYADFQVDDQTYINSVRHGDADDSHDIPVRMIPPGDDIVYTGTIYSFDNKIDAASGTIRARALFKNENGVLLSGMTVSIMMGSAAPEGKILVSERAIGTDQDRKFVYVVTPENKTAYREIKLGESIDGRRVILSGLQKGDLVITEGVMRIRPDMPVVPQIIVDEKKPQASTPPDDKELEKPATPEKK